MNNVGTVRKFKIIKEGTIFVWIYWKNSEC